MAMTAEQLIAAVLRRCFWPSTNAPLTNAQILAIADEEILGTLYPTVIAAHADYYSATLDQALVASQSKYRLPGSAYGPLKDVTIVDSQGSEFSVTLSDAEDVGHGLWFNRYYGQYNNGGCSFTMFFEGDFLQLRPLPNASINTLRIRYYRQPCPLALMSTATLVGSVTSVASKIFTIQSTPAGFAAGLYASVFSQGNAHQMIVDSGYVSTLTGGGTVVTLQTAAPAAPSIADIASNDYVVMSTVPFNDLGPSLGPRSPIVQLPDFMLTACVRRVAAACLQAHGDDRANVEFAESNRLIELAIETATPRTEGEPRLVTTTNSPWRSGRVAGSWGRY